MTALHQAWRFHNGRFDDGIPELSCDDVEARIRSMEPNARWHTAPTGQRTLSAYDVRDASGERRILFGMQNVSEFVGVGCDGIRAMLRSGKQVNGFAVRSLTAIKRRKVRNERRATNNREAP